MILKKRYDEIMDKIQVTDEMHNRILDHIQKSDLQKTKPFKITWSHTVKKYGSIAACLVILAASAVVLPSLWKQPENPAILEGSDIVTVSSLPSLATVVGFEPSGIPSLPFEVQETIYTVYWQELAEITYYGETQVAVFRQSRGSVDNSGDYSSYDTQTTLSADGIPVTLKGSGDIYSLAIWENNGFSYSIRLSSGIPQSDWPHMIAKAGQ